MLNQEQKQFVMNCWNTSYPAQLSFKGIEGLESFLNPLGDPHHYLCIDAQGTYTGWAIAFIRDNERWFSIIVSNAFHNQGIGKLLMSTLKSDFDELLGWVIDHNNYVRTDGEPYPSPLEFYLKQQFIQIPWKRLELPHLSAVQIKSNTINDNHVLETERFILRQMTIEDGKNAYQLNLDSDVVKYTGDIAFESVEEAAKFLAAYDQYKKYGFGRWAIINKSNGDYMGWCGLKCYDDSKEIDVGYRLLKEHWGKGIASETARACVDYGLNQLGIPFIVAHAMKENVASIRVMQKIGMTYHHDYIYNDKEWVSYKIEGKSQK